MLTLCREEDVSQTLYKDTLKSAKDEPTAELKEGTAVPFTKPSKDNKVNRICDGFLAALENRVDTNLRNLITAHVCKSPPDLEAALRLTARLRGQSCSRLWSPFGIWLTKFQSKIRSKQKMQSNTCAS